MVNLLPHPRLHPPLLPPAQKDKIYVPTHKNTTKYFVTYEAYKKKLLLQLLLMFK